jgi:hypothetical protein
MAFTFPSPDHLPCPDCGASIPVTDDGARHACDAERRDEFQRYAAKHVSEAPPETQSDMASEFPPYEAQTEIELSDSELQAEVDSFVVDFAAWLDTPEGRFSQWLAERDR